MPTITVSEKLTRRCTIEVTHCELAMLLAGKSEVADEHFIRAVEEARAHVIRIARGALDDTEVTSNSGIMMSRDGRYL